MKSVGSHKNIVTLIGCCTVKEPMFLLTEFVPYGSLLKYLRKHRGQVFISIKACIENSFLVKFLLEVMEHEVIFLARIELV